MNSASWSSPPSHLLTDSNTVNIGCGGYWPITASHKHRLKMRRPPILGQNASVTMCKEPLSLLHWFIVAKYQDKDFTVWQPTGIKQLHLLLPTAWVVCRHFWVLMFILEGRPVELCFIMSFTFIFIPPFPVRDSVITDVVTGEPRLNHNIWSVATLQ